MPGVSEVSEREAKGDVADVYADIRKTCDLPIVNLIWRHLATQPDALTWAWRAARSLYASGIAAAEAERLVATLPLPAFPQLNHEVLAVLKISPQDAQTIGAVLDVYNRGNSLNFIALHAVIAEGTNRTDGTVLPDPGAAKPPPRPNATALLPIPPIPSMESLSSELQAMVLRLNEIGSPPPHDSQIVASLYRHLAPWPEYLALAWSGLAVLDADGTLNAIMDDLRARGVQCGARVAAERGRSLKRPTDPRAAQFARTAIESFIQNAISRMIPIGLLLRRALG